MTLMRYIDRQEKYVSSRASPYRWISLWSIKMSEHLQFSPLVWFEHRGSEKVRMTLWAGSFDYWWSSFFIERYKSHWKARINDWRQSTIQRKEKYQWKSADFYLFRSIRQIDWEWLFNSRPSDHSLTLTRCRPPCRRTVRKSIRFFLAFNQDRLRS